MQPLSNEVLLHIREVGQRQHPVDQAHRRGERKVRRGHELDVDFDVSHRVAQKPAPAPVRIFVPQFDEEHLRAFT